MPLHQFIFPPFLKAGDRIMIVSPSGKMDTDILQQTAQILQTWGLSPVLAPHADAGFGSYAGTIEQRYQDFQDAMDDEQIAAIFCSRGGYGVVHFMDRLSFEGMARHPKWLTGFSDISALHALFQYHGFAGIHAPMGKHLVTEGSHDPCSIALKDLLFGKPVPPLTLPTHRLNKTGTAKGILRGGNLTVIQGLRATPYDIPADGSILFIEDVGEKPHTIERMLYNLKLGGVLQRLSGLIVGQFTDYLPADNLLSKDLYEAIADIVGAYDFPVCFDFPVGHCTGNTPLICGAEVQLSVEKHVTTLSYLL